MTTTKKTYNVKATKKNKLLENCEVSVKPTPKMKIKIVPQEVGGFSVERLDAKGEWQHWLPEATIDPRGDEYYEYFKTFKGAVSAAKKEKAREEELNQEYIMEI